MENTEDKYEFVEHYEYSSGRKYYPRTPSIHDFEKMLSLMSYPNLVHVDIPISCYPFITD